MAVMKRASLGAISLPRRLYASAAAASRTSSATTTLARRHAEAESGRWKGTDTLGGPTKLYIDGSFVDSATDRWIDVHDPVRSPILPRRGIRR